MAKNLRPGGRDRLSNAQARRKNGNICVATLRNIYGEDFAPGYRGDVTLNSLLKRSGSHSLSEYLKHESSRKLMMNPTGR